MSWVAKRTERGTWVYRWTESGKTYQRTMPKSIRTKRDAERVQRAWDEQREAHAKKHRSGVPWTIDRAYEEVAKSNLSPRYQRERDRYVSNLKAFFGDTPLAQINVGAIKRWVVWCLERPGRAAAKVRNSTIRHEYYTLSQLFQAAVENGALVENPCNSNIAVEAVIAGTPAFTGGRSMAERVACLDLSRIEDPPRLDRTQWAHWIANCQWTTDELRAGTPWQVLMGVK